MACVIYRYEIKSISNPSYVRDQLGKCRRYRNRLIEIERKRRQDVDAARSALFPDYAELEEQVAAAKERKEQLIDDIKRTKQRARRNATTPDQRDAVKLARAEYSALYRQLKDRKAALWSDEQLQQQLAAIDEQDHAARLEARNWISNTVGLYSGSYLGIEQSLKDLRKGRPPQFRRWDGVSGRLTVQLKDHQAKTYGLSWEQVTLGNSTLLRAQRDGKYWRVSIRLGSEQRKPVWIDCKIVMHRPLPDGVKIKWVYLVAKRQGRDAKYYVCFVVEREEGFAKERADDGHVAIDVGWRLVREGLRVAYWSADRPITEVPPHLAPFVQLHEGGLEGELLIPYALQRPKGGMQPGCLEYVKKARDLQEIRDKRFDVVIAALRRYVAGLDPVPDWMAAAAGEAVKYLDRIKSKPRMLDFAKAWQRHQGDDEILSTLQEWIEKEDHLEKWETAQRTKFQVWRKWLYESFWAMMRQNYGTAFVEKIDKTELRAKPKPEDRQDKGLVQYRNVASIGLLVNLGGHCHGNVREINPAYTTSTCHACGAICDFDQATDLVHTCEHCGALWDQDANAARNLLASGLASGEVVNETVGAARNAETDA